MQSITIKTDLFYSHQPLAVEAHTLPLI